MSKEFKYFSVDELYKSETANKNRINNFPDDLSYYHLYEILPYLDALREAWGSPLIVTSGYRCPELNKILGGVSNSAHLTGYAVDLVSNNHPTIVLYRFIEDWLKRNNYKFDQLIYEKSKYTSWVHLSFKGNNDEQRLEVKNIKNKGNCATRNARNKRRSTHCSTD